MPKVVPEYKDQARARIVDAAAAVLRRGGLPAGTMEEIAREIGVSKGALYLYFPTKTRLLAAVQERFRSYYLGVLQRRLSRGDPATAIVESMDEILGDRFDPSVWHRLASDAASDPEVRDQLRRDSREDRKAIRELLQALAARGRIRPSDDFDSVAGAVMLLLQGMYSAIALRADAAESRADLQRSLRLVLGVPPTGARKSEPRSSQERPATSLRGGRRPGESRPVARRRRPARQ